MCVCMHTINHVMSFPGFSKLSARITMITSHRWFACTVLLSVLCPVLHQVGAQTTKKTFTTLRPTGTTFRGRVTGSPQQEWTWKTFPNPQLQPGLCARGSARSWVCDPNGVLTITEGKYRIYSVLYWQYSESSQLIGITRKSVLLMIL